LLVLCKLADRLGADVETLLAAPDSEEVAKIDR